MPLYFVTQMPVSLEVKALQLSKSLRRPHAQCGKDTRLPCTCSPCYKASTPICGFERTVHRRNSDATRYAWWEYASPLVLKYRYFESFGARHIVWCTLHPSLRGYGRQGALAQFSLGPCQASFGSLDTDTCVFFPVSSRKPKTYETGTFSERLRLFSPANPAENE